MNLFRKSYTFILLFLWLPGLNSPQLLGRTNTGNPWYPEIVSFYLPVEYNTSPTTSLCRTINGITIIGKKNGILTIDNSRIHYIPFNNPVFVSCTSGDSVICRSGNDTGRLTFDADGNPAFITHPEERKNWFGEYSAEKEAVRFHLFDDLYLTRPEAGGLNIVKGVNSRIVCSIPASEVSLETVNSVFVDHFQDIWICDDFSVIKIEFPSRNCFVDLSATAKGNALAARGLGNTLYLSSTAGLFTLRFNAESFPEFNQIECKNDLRITQFATAGDQIAAIADNGLYRITDSGISLQDTGRFVFIDSPDESSFTGLKENSVIQYTVNENDWETHVLGDIQGEVISMIIYDQYCWILTDQSLIYTIGNASFGETGINLKTHPRNYRFVRYRDVLLLFSESEVYVWNGEYRLFEYAHPSGFNFPLTGLTSFHSGKKDWYSQYHENGSYTIGNLVFPDKMPLYELTPDKKLGDIIEIDETASAIWITGRNKILIHKKDTSAANFNFPLRIESMEFIPRHANRHALSLAEDESVKFRRHDLVVTLKSPRYIHPANLYFRYRITKKQEEWSEWKRENTIAFSNLFERDYTFQAQAMSAFGDLSDIAYFDFTITPPFYRTWFAYAMYVFLFLVASFLGYKARLLDLKRGESRVEQQVRERMASVMLEKEKSDKLVSDLFPKGTLEEFKNSGRAKTKKFELVTVLFSDIQGFTKIAEEMNPEILIDELDKFFFHFDSVVEKYNIEKIKTIGDAYMAAGGIPVKNSSNPVEVVLAGLEMQYYMKDLKKKKTNIWDLRIGIHTGPVIAGVVGQKKLSYDIWGDTVNTASRMESSGESGKVNISGVTYGLIKDYFICEHRGKLPVKYKGNIDMYFVTGLRPELSVNLEGIPNKRFFIKLQLLRLKDIERRLYDEILSEKALNLQMHNAEHIHKVINQAELLCRSENIPEEEMLLVQSAAVLLFAGLSESLTGFETISSEIARRILPEYSYKPRQIEQICNIILACRAPFQPQSKLEEILIDARMEFIGRPDYPTCVKRLYLELKSLDNSITLEKVVEEQVSLLAGFQFYSLAAQRLREVDPDTQIANLKAILPEK